MAEKKGWSISVVAMAKVVQAAAEAYDAAVAAHAACEAIVDTDDALGVSSAATWCRAACDAHIAAQAVAMLAEAAAEDAAKTYQAAEVVAEAAYSDRKAQDAAAIADMAGES